MVSPLVISFYTIDTPYQKEVERLRASCERFGIEHHIAGLPSRGRWEHNCAMKGLFIRDRLEEFRRPVLWIDADGEIVAPLEYFDDTPFDLACYVQWSEDRQPPRMDSREMPFMSGTLYFNFTTGGRRAAEVWANYCQANPDVWDQVPLALTWWELKDEITFSSKTGTLCSSTRYRRT